MRKVTYFGAKLRRVVNRSAPGQAKGHGLLPDRGGQRQSARDRRERGQRGVAYIKQLLAHCISAPSSAPASKGSQMEPQAKRKMRASKKRDPTTNNRRRRRRQPR